ncbi:MAG: hypothetical protein P9M00_11760, partial [Candidatus Tritonobacter lacicola]|nr:hypothetical protein [Candidatus Tritonobacter lacicola]
SAIKHWIKHRGDLYREKQGVTAQIRRKNLSKSAILDYFGQHWVGPQYLPESISDYTITSVLPASIIKGNDSTTTPFVHIP